jgi:hypothetical protein
MAFKRKDLEEFARGDDWTLKITLVDSNNQIIDITGNSYWMTLKSDPANADPGDAQIGPIVAGSPDAANGIIYMTFPKAQTSILTPGSYHYDFQQVDDQGNVQTLLLGKVKVAADITRSTS